MIARLTTLVVLCALAASPLQSAAPSTFVLDPVHSVALFGIQHVQAGRFWGRINALEGTVTYPADDSAGPEFDVVAKLVGIDTGNEKLDQNLKGPNFFNAVEFPELRFRSISAERIEARRWRVKGEMTIRGVTKDATAEVEVTGVAEGQAGTSAGFEATLTIERSDFGMEWGIAKPPNALGNSVRLLVAMEGGAKKAS